MNEKQFRKKFENRPISDDRKAWAFFEPMFSPPTCPHDSDKKLKRGEDFKTGDIIYYCNDRFCNQSCSYPSTRSLRAKVTPNKLKAIRVIYKVTGRAPSKGKEPYTTRKVKEKQIKPEEQDKIDVVIKTFKTLYNRGITGKHQLEESLPACNIRGYKPLHVIGKEYLPKIDKVMRKYGFKVFTPNNCDTWRYNVYKFKKPYLEQLYKDSSGHTLILRIPAQSETKTDSWFILDGVIAVENVNLIDSEGDEYSFPIPKTSPMRKKVYSYRDDDKVSIEQAISKLDKRLSNIFEEKFSEESVASEKAKEIIQNVQEMFPKKTAVKELSKNGTKVGGYLVKGNMGNYFAQTSIDKNKRLRIDIYKALKKEREWTFKDDKLTSVLVGKSLFELYNKTASILYCLVNDTEGLEKLKKE